MGEADICCPTDLLKEQEMGRVPDHRWRVEQQLITGSMLFILSLELEGIW